MTEPFADTDNVKVLDFDDWDHIVTAIGGDRVYHSLGYHLASAQLEPDRTTAVLLGNQPGAAAFALPLLLRPITGTKYWDATSAYGYGGPLIDGVNPNELQGWLDAWARKNDVVSSFIRFHPLLKNATRQPQAREAGATVAWDLRSGRDLAEAMHPHHRRACRKADRAGLEVHVQDEVPNLSRFRELYDATMRRNNAASDYFFDDSYWNALHEHLSESLLLVNGSTQGTVVASLLMFRAHPYLHYHLGASADEARIIGATPRLFLEAAQWGQTSGYSHVHLGGGLGGRTDSGLFTFKARFDPSAEHLPFHVARNVHDRERFDQLSQRSSLETTFFPPWRAPEQAD